MPNLHIQQFPINTLGHDYIIGDVHGANMPLREVIARINEHDRLFIVGDLFDRGPDSPDVFEAIQEAKRAGKHIYVTRGNHEEVFLATLNTLFNPPPTFVFDNVGTFLMNRGEWIFPPTETREELLVLVKDINTALRNKENISELKARFFERVFSLWEGVDGKKREQLQQIKAMIEALPYIIVVGALGEPNSFIVCHADMPMDDANLQLRLDADALLDSAELHHVLWARPDQNKEMNKGVTRTQHFDSTLVYCGHNVVGFRFGKGQKVSCVRASSNHVNLDVGAHSKNAFLLMNHTQGECCVVSCEQRSPDEEQQRLMEIACIISTHVRTSRGIAAPNSGFVASGAGEGASTVTSISDDTAVAAAADSGDLEARIPARRRLSYVNKRMAFFACSGAAVVVASALLQMSNLLKPGD